MEHIRDNNNDEMTEVMTRVCEVVHAIPNAEVESVAEETCSLIEVRLTIGKVRYQISALKRCTDSPQSVAEKIKYLILETNK